MKKGLFNASFEESKNLVDDKYMNTTLKYTTRKIINNRLFIVFLTNSVIVFIASMSILIDNLGYEDGLQPPIELSYFNFLWFGVAIFVPINYFFSYIKSFKKRMLNEYYTDRTLNLILIIISLQVYPLLLYGVVYLTRLPILYYMCTLYCLLFITHHVLEMRDQLKRQLFLGKLSENSFMIRVEKFVSFSDKYGGFVLLLLLIYRLLFQDGGTIGEVVNVVFITFAPILILIVGTFIVKGMFRSAILPGYYLKKYYDEYRIEYGFTEEEWNKGMDFEEAKKKVEIKLQNSSVNSIK